MELPIDAQERLAAAEPQHPQREQPEQAGSEREHAVAAGSSTDDLGHAIEPPRLRLELDPAATSDVALASAYGLHSAQDTPEVRRRISHYGVL